MYKIRTTTTKSNATAVQIVIYINHKIKIIKHIGSAHSDEELKKLKLIAFNWIEKNNPQLSLFKINNLNTSTLVLVNNLKLIHTTPKLIYQLCMKTISGFGFDKVLDQLFLDLVFIRIIEPASKLTSIKLLSSEFLIFHSLRTLQRNLRLVTKQKTVIERLAVTYAKEHLNFEFKVVFYDVTTLYWESFKVDEVGKGVKLSGFSKDNKHQQPQVVLGLVVTKEGFPLEFRIFAGNKFEGHTLLPVLRQLRRHYKIDRFTVVADAAMISRANVESLRIERFSYIVGARLYNLKRDFFNKVVQQLPRVDKATIRIKDKVRGWLICQFSKSRYFKDKYETEKQVKRAKANLRRPSKAIKRLKFIKVSGGEDLKFNYELLEKTKKLWGVKGYYTDCEQMSDQEVINYYHNLWHVEKAFRISKTDLQVRPIYHRKTEHIIAHLLICFMALCVVKHWERKTNLSIRKLVRLLRNIRDVEFQDKLTQQTFTLRKELNIEESSIVEKLNNFP